MHSIGRRPLDIPTGKGRSDSRERLYSVRQATFCGHRGTCGKQCGINFFPAES
ncbi:hypothetical protein HF324_28660 [Chitinophaga oryzae]|uniref:Uncharacterized protein n=1 Tax=Chitinophaga oryzae TaxID=2725414 RepID=A0AAE7DAL3_9BACT|nr:hypothetical protein [Chitinophaga oryzae]QJB35085.1 hypothetical protein HF329_28785 [Chitinophaga oryzae]QJB41602.1 hypothetical protein HF324_28660 [Chitinophaga oryzae]